jgi:hypothetical protein
MTVGFAAAGACRVFWTETEERREGIAHMASPPTSSNVATVVVELVTTRIAPREMRHRLRDRTPSRALRR